MQELPVSDGRYHQQMQQRGQAPPFAGEFEDVETSETAAMVPATTLQPLNQETLVVLKTGAPNRRWKESHVSGRPMVFTRTPHTVPFPSSHGTPPNHRFTHVRLPPPDTPRFPSRPPDIRDERRVEQGIGPLTPPGPPRYQGSHSTPPGNGNRFGQVRLRSPPENPFRPGNPPNGFGRSEGLFRGNVPPQHGKFQGGRPLQDAPSRPLLPTPVGPVGHFEPPHAEGPSGGDIFPQVGELHHEPSRIPASAVSIRGCPSDFLRPSFPRDEYFGVVDLPLKSNSVDAFSLPDNRAFHSDGSSPPNGHSSGIPFTSPPGRVSVTAPFQQKAEEAMKQEPENYSYRRGPTPCSPHDRNSEFRVLEEQRRPVRSNKEFLQYGKPRHEHIRDHQRSSAVSGTPHTQPVRHAFRDGINKPQIAQRNSPNSPQMVTAASCLVLTHLRRLPTERNNESPGSPQLPPTEGNRESAENITVFDRLSPKKPAVLTRENSQESSVFQRLSAKKSPGSPSVFERLSARSSSEVFSFSTLLNDDTKDLAPPTMTPHKFRDEMPLETFSDAKNMRAHRVIIFEEELDADQKSSAVKIKLELKLEEASKKSPEVEIEESYQKRMEELDRKSDKSRNGSGLKTGSEKMKKSPKKSAIKSVCVVVTPALKAIAQYGTEDEEEKMVEEEPKSEMEREENPDSSVFHKAESEVKKEKSVAKGPSEKAEKALSPSKKGEKEQKKKRKSRFTDTAPTASSAQPVGRKDDSPKPVCNPVTVEPHRFGRTFGTPPPQNVTSKKVETAEDDLADVPLFRIGPKPVAQELVSKKTDSDAKISSGDQNTKLDEKPTEGVEIGLFRSAPTRIREDAMPTKKMSYFQQLNKHRMDKLNGIISADEPFVLVSSPKRPRDCDDDDYSRSTRPRLSPSSSQSREPIIFGRFTSRFESPLNGDVKFIDSHSHWDFFLNRLKDSQVETFMDIKKTFAEGFPVSYGGAIQVFCAPESFRDMNSLGRRWENMEGNFWLTYGCHPHFVDKWDGRVREDMERCMLSAQKANRLVALGECGLDYNGDQNRLPEKQTRQRKVLRVQLEIAIKWDLPVVIHCRNDESSAGNDQAELDCIDIVKEVLPKTWPVHRHCFHGSSSDADKWIEYFDNIVFGFTPNISSHGSSDVVRNLPLKRIVLETDAPYFVPRGIRNLPSDDRGKALAIPGGFALFTAYEIAEIKGLSVEEVVRVTRENTIRTYKLEDRI